MNMLVLKQDKIKILEKRNVKLLEINTDNELKIDKYVLEIYSMADRKLSALAQMSKLFFFRKRRTRFKISSESQFKYWHLLILVLHNRCTNNRVNRFTDLAHSL